MAENEREKAVSKLRKACHEAYLKYPKSCSHSVWYVITQYKPDQKWKNANDLIKELQKNAHWKTVQLSEVGELANQGVLVVGGKTGNENGHVIVVYPGQAKKSGGYDYFNKRRGKIEKFPSQGTFPLAMSTSISRNWNGTMSDGDKTIIDPWPNAFQKVQFWKYVGNSEGKEMKGSENKQ